MNGTQILLELTLNHLCALLHLLKEIDEANYLVSISLENKICAASRETREFLQVINFEAALSPINA